jgi:ribosomal protein L7Ae-like RNA K-turn-binding protein
MSKTLSYLGLAMRAGKIVTGDEAVLKAVRSSEAKLVVWQVTLQIIPKEVPR